MPPQSSPAKHWCFTLNNPRYTSDQMLSAFEDWELQYGVFQYEVSASGTPHFQGYLEFKNRTRLTAISRLKCAERMHFEKRRGTRNEARDYAMKRDTRTRGPFEYGEWQEAAQGRRSDLANVCDMLQTGSSLVEVAVAQPTTYVRYHRGLQHLVNIQPRQRQDAPDVTLLIGPPGCGKTRSVRDTEPYDQLWCSPPSAGMKWYDEYQNQEAALFDDFDGKASQVPLSTVLQILDRYAIRVPVKGGFTWWLPKRVYVTTNVHPRNWYDWSTRECQYGALSRRFTHVITWSFEEVEPEPLLLTPGHLRWADFWANLI